MPLLSLPQKGNWPRQRTRDTKETDGAIAYKREESVPQDSAAHYTGPWVGECGSQIGQKKKPFGKVGKRSRSGSVPFLIK